MKTLGVKHLIECHCTLKIYEGKTGIQDHLYHKFPVYSQMSKNGKIIEKIAQCNNCNTLHRVYDYCKSELIERGKDEIISAVDKEDIKLQLSEKIIKVLSKYKVDISTWEHALDIYDNQVWGENIVLSREIIDQKYHVKILKIESENKIKILTKVIEDEI